MATNTSSIQLQRLEIPYFDGVNTLVDDNLSKKTELYRCENARSEKIGSIEKRADKQRIGTDISATANYHLFYFVDENSVSKKMYRISTVGESTKVYYLNTGATWTALTDSDAIKLLELGDSTSQFDISNPYGSTWRYTWDGNGTDPDIDAHMSIGSTVVVAAQNFNAVNNGTFTITGVSADYFDVTNVGTAEGNKTIGTGSITVSSGKFQGIGAGGRYFFVNGDIHNRYIEKDGVTVISSASTAGQLYNCPTAHLVNFYKGRLYVGDYVSGNIRYKTGVMMSSLPLGIISLVDGDHAAGVTTVNVVETKYIKSTDSLDVYRGGTLIETLTVSAKAEDSITVTATANALLSSDELWVSGTYSGTKSLGDSTTQFDISAPAGTTFRYTWDATGTDPNIDAHVNIGSTIVINAQNFTANNNGTFTVTDVGSNYFSVTNAIGITENNKTIGTGSIVVSVDRTFRWAGNPAGGENIKQYDTFKLSGGDEDELTMMANIGDVMIIANKRNMAVWDDYNLKSFDFGIGCVSKNGYTKNKGVLFFLDYSGLYATTGDRPQLMSAKVDEYFKGATKEGLEAGKLGMRDMSIFAHIGSVTLYKIDGSVEKTLTDVVMEYNLRQENCFVHTGIKADQFETYIETSNVDRLLFTMNDSSGSDFEVYELLYKENDLLIDTEIPFMVTTQKIYLSKEFEKYAYPKAVIVEVTRGSGVQCYLSLDDGDFYALEDEAIKGINTLKVTPYSYDSGLVKCRTIRLSLREYSNRICKITKVALLYSLTEEERESEKDNG